MDSTSDNKGIECNIKVSKTIKPVECEFKLTPNCLKIKTIENKLGWHGKTCRICREFKKTNNNAKKLYTENFKKKHNTDIDAEYIKQKREYAKKYYAKNKAKILEKVKERMKKNIDLDKKSEDEK